MGSIHRFILLIIPWLNSIWILVEYIAHATYTWPHHWSRKLLWCTWSLMQNCKLTRWKKLMYVCTECTVLQFVSLAIVLNLNLYICYAIHWCTLLHRMSSITEAMLDTGHRCSSLILNIDDSFKLIHIAFHTSEPWFDTSCKANLLAISLRKNSCKLHWLPTALVHSYTWHANAGHILLLTMCGPVGRFSVHVLRSTHLLLIHPCVCWI